MKQQKKETGICLYCRFAQYGGADNTTRTILVKCAKKGHEVEEKYNCKEGVHFQWRPVKS